MTEEFQWTDASANLGVYFQSSTGYFTAHYLVVAVGSFSFCGDENLTCSIKIRSTINVKVGIMLGWICLSTNESLPNKVYAPMQVRNKTSPKTAFAVAHTTEPIWNKFFCAVLDSSLSSSKLKGPLHQEKVEDTNYLWRLVPHLYFLIVLIFAVWARPGSA